VMAAEPTVAPIAASRDLPLEGLGSNARGYRDRFPNQSGCDFPFWLEPDSSTQGAPGNGPAQVAELFGAPRLAFQQQDKNKLFSHEWMIASGRPQLYPFHFPICSRT
jgi:hypothetical protein